MSAKPTEEVVLAVWTDELGVQVGADDHFFRCGGNSLGAARATINLSEALSRDIELATLLENPIARDYAAAVDAVASGASSRLPVVARDGVLPLSYQQEARLERERDAAAAGGQAGPYFLPLIIAFDMNIEAHLVEAAINLLIARHESLRTGFKIGAARSGHRAFAVESALVELEALEVGAIAAEARDSLVAATYAAMVGVELDFMRVPLIRAKLLHLGATSSVLILAVEHIVFDGWSTGILFNELMAVLRGHQLPALEAQYADWAGWHNKRLQGDSLLEILDFWRHQLVGTSPFPPLALPMPSEPLDGMCAEVSHVLPVPYLEMLENRAKVLETTLFVVVLTAFARAWQRISGSTDVVIHGPTANRAVPQSQAMIGNFAHSLVYRLNSPCDKDRGTAIAATGAVVAEALGHQEIPLSLLTRYLQPEAHGRATHLPRLYVARSVQRQLESPVDGGTARTVALRDVPVSAEPGVAAFYTDGDTGALTLRLLFRPAEVDRAFVAELLTVFAAELTEIAEP